MHKDRMFKQKCNLANSEQLCSVESGPRIRTKSKSFAKVSSRFSITLQELKQDVQKVVPRHRFVSGGAIWTELEFLNQCPPSLNALFSAIEFDQDEDLDSGCEDVESEGSSIEQEDSEEYQSEKFQKFGWFEHVELYLERAGQIPSSDPEHVIAADIDANISELSTETLPEQEESLPEVTTLPSVLDFSLTSSVEIDSVADVVHKLIEQISNEMFSPIEAADPVAAVSVAGAENVPSNAGYVTASGQDETKGGISSQRPASSSMASGREATGRVNSDPVIAMTPLHGRPVPLIRSVLKKRPALDAIETPSTVKKRVTFSEIGCLLNPYEERDRRVFLENHETIKALNDSNILEKTLPRQQSTPKVGHAKSRGAKRKCVYDFDDDFEEKEEEEELSRSATVSTQTDTTDITDEMIQTIVQHTIISFKEAEQVKSEEDSTNRAIEALVQATAASFHVDESKPKKKKKKSKLDILNDSMDKLHKRFDRLEKRQRRPKKPRRLIVKKVVPAKSRPSTDRCTQTEAPSTAEASVATTFELSKPPSKPRAPRKRASKAKAKQSGDPVAECSAPKTKLARRKVDRDQQTIPQCLNGDGGGSSMAAAAPPQVDADVLRDPKKAAGRKVVQPDVVRMDDGQLVAEDSEDNLSQEFEIEESLPPLSPAPSRTLVDLRLIKGVHRKPPSIIDTQPNSPASCSQPDSPASHYSIPNHPDQDDDEDTESFNRWIYRLRIGSDSQLGSSTGAGLSKQQAVKSKPRRQKPYPKSPKLRPPPAQLVSRLYSQTFYPSPVQESTPITRWNDSSLLPWDTCEYLRQRLQPVISEGRLRSLQESYGDPCWFISLDVACQLLFGSDGDDGDGGVGTEDMTVPQYPNFSQEFSPIAFAVDSSGSEVPDDEC